MDKKQISALFYISDNCNTETLAKLAKRFDHKIRYGSKSVFDFLMHNGYIAVSNENRRYCYVTQMGNALLEAIVGMTELIKNN